LLFSSLFAVSQTYTSVGDVSNPTTFCYCLNENGSEASAVWLDNGITIDGIPNSVIVFDQTYEVFLGSNDGGGHGISMTLQQESNTAIGSGGSALGYGGPSGITSAIHFEIDTYADAHSGDAGLGGSDHIAITTNGNFGIPPTLAGPLAIPNIEDGNYHALRVIVLLNKLSPSNSQATLVLDDVYSLSTTFNPFLIFSGTSPLYVGFTGGIDATTTNIQRVSFAAPGTPGSCSSFTFPVEFIDFTATPGPGLSVNLDWRTASELNNSHFEIRRSLDGQFWEYLGEVEGVGTTQEVQSYRFTDYQARPGRQYYQLRQVDLDGSYALSEVVEVYVGMGEQRFTVHAWPNPAQTQTQIRVEGMPQQGPLLLEVVDINGRRLIARQFASRGKIETTVDLSSLSPGLYWVRAGEQDNMVSQMLRVTR